MSTTYNILCDSLDTLADVKNLHKRVSFPDKNLSDIPAEVIHFTGDIHSFNARKNQLSQVPVSVCYFGPRLRKLDLESNSIRHIPSEIRLLINLEELCLEHNQLTEVPDEIGALKKLERLNLGHNQLQKIPTAIIHLTALKKFLGSSFLKIIEAHCFLDFSKRLTCRLAGF